jgi:hypothetical protein
MFQTLGCGCLMVYSFLDASEQSPVRVRTTYILYENSSVAEWSQRATTSMRMQKTAAGITRRRLWSYTVLKLAVQR